MSDADNDVLARLVRLAEERGGDMASLRALIEQASEAGATRAMAQLGLADASARDDIAELRELLAAWRDAKRSAWKAVVDWVVRGALAAVLIGLAVKLGFAAWLK